MQLELINSTKHGTVAKDIAFGACFKRKNDYFMRMKPTGWLLNSNLIGEAINASKVLVVNLKTGSCFIIHGLEEVQKAQVKVMVTA